MPCVILSQCRSVKITIMGEEGVPVQVDGEAWVQPPGFIRIVHKNRAQMLTRDKVCEMQRPGLLQMLSIKLIDLTSYAPAVNFLLHVIETDCLERLWMALC